MRRRLFNASTLLALGMLTLSAHAAEAQTTAVGPYYATPSWDQQLQCDAPNTCPRFIVLSNWRDAEFPSGGAAVLDRETGLVWERSPDISVQARSTASLRCASSYLGGRWGWRLPGLQELLSLFIRDAVTGDLLLPPGHPFQDADPLTYWASTISEQTSFWGVGGSGTIRAGAASGFELRRWCVRGGQGVDPQ
jgi:hypothetical protein